jgi:hypothetical protein
MPFPCTKYDTLGTAGTVFGLVKVGDNTNTPGTASEYSVGNQTTGQFHWGEDAAGNPATPPRQVIFTARAAVGSVAGSTTLQIASATALTDVSVQYTTISKLIIDGRVASGAAHGLKWSNVQLRTSSSASLESPDCTEFALGIFRTLSVSAVTDVGRIEYTMPANTTWVELVADFELGSTAPVLQNDIRGRIHVIP